MLLTLTLSVAMVVSQLFNQILTVVDLMWIHEEGICPSQTRVGWLCIASPPPTFIFVLEKDNLYQMFSIFILLLSPTDTSQECSYLIHHDFFLCLALCPSLKLYNQPLPLQVSSGYTFLSVLVLTTYVFVAFYLVPKVCHLVANWTHLFFPCFWFAYFSYPLSALSGTCLAFLHFF